MSQRKRLMKEWEIEDTKSKEKEDSKEVPPVRKNQRLKKESESANINVEASLDGMEPLEVPLKMTKKKKVKEQLETEKEITNLLPTDNSPLTKHRKTAKEILSEKPNIESRGGLVKMKGNYYYEDNDERFITEHYDDHDPGSDDEQNSQNIYRRLASLETRKDAESTANPIERLDMQDHIFMYTLDRVLSKNDKQVLKIFTHNQGLIECEIFLNGISHQEIILAGNSFYLVGGRCLKGSNPNSVGSFDYYLEDQSLYREDVGYTCKVNVVKSCLFGPTRWITDVDDNEPKLNVPRHNVLLQCIYQAKYQRSTSGSSKTIKVGQIPIIYCVGGYHGNEESTICEKYVIGNQSKNHKWTRIKSFNKAIQAYALFSFNDRYLYAVGQDVEMMDCTEEENGWTSISLGFTRSLLHYYLLIPASPVSVLILGTANLESRIDKNFDVIKYKKVYGWLPLSHGKLLCRIYNGIIFFTSQRNFYGFSLINWKFVTFSNHLPSLRNVIVLKIREKVAEKKIPLDQLFKKLDKDGNGVLSPAEIECLFICLDIGVHSKEVRELICFADLNKDGKIQYDEFIKLISPPSSGGLVEEEEDKASPKAEAKNETQYEDNKEEDEEIVESKVNATENAIINEEPKNEEEKGETIVVTDDP